MHVRLKIHVEVYEIIATYLFLRTIGVPRNNERDETGKDPRRGAHEEGGNIGKAEGASQGWLRNS
jgi:hypothetical protein